MLGNKVKRAHYVPRMYLKRFESPEKRLCVWNIETHKLLTNQNRDNFAVKGYFYDACKEDLNLAFREIRMARPQIASRIDTSDEQLIEHYLDKSESDASKIIDQICQDHKAFYKKENVQKLLIFLHDLAYRTEAFRECAVPIDERLFAEEVKAGTFGEYAQRYQLAGIRPLMYTTQMLIRDYKWYVATVPGKMKLVISDNPAQGIVDQQDDICIPLCGDTAIIFRRKTPKEPLCSRDVPNGREIVLSERSVFIYNAFQRQYANRFMFGNQESLEFVKYMYAKEF